MKLCFICRGVPSSGKSTLSKELSTFHNAEIASADDYFVNESGKYKFDASKLNLAHMTCRQQFLDCLVFDKNIIVDNTNIATREFMWYLEEAYKRNYLVVVVEPIDMMKAVGFNCEAEWARIFAERNTHGVPEAKILEKLKAWKRFDELLSGDVDYVKRTNRATYYFSYPKLELP